MAHVGQEHALGPAGRLRGILRGGKFCGTREDQFFEVVAMLF
jgi:hypothetical protein